MNRIRRLKLMLKFLVPCGLYGMLYPVVLPRPAFLLASSLSADNNYEKPSIRLTKTLGIDYGLSRCGLALSCGYAAAQPVAIIDGPEYINQMIDCMRLYEVKQIVLGWPLEKNGTISNQAMLTREFGMTLKESVCRRLGNIPVYLCDERYTSKAARATLANGNEGLPHVDAVAACMILDSFFEGEVVTELTLPDGMLDECLAEYEQKKAIEDAKRRATLENLDLLRRRRRETIARDQMYLNEESLSTKKPKKKKKIRRR